MKGCSKKFIIAITVIVGLCLVSCKDKGASIDTSKQEEAAVKVAESWLQLTDKGEYGKSWDESAEFFKKAITREKWEKSLEAVIQPLGKMLKRTIDKKKYATSLPGAPDGEYVVIKFISSWKNKKEAIETVTPMKDKDGKWRVSGYYIK